MIIKKFKILFVMLMLSVSLFSQEKITQKNSIQFLVSKVKKAPPSQRRVLMNQLKIKLRSMNKATRKNIMRHLRQKFNKNHSSMSIKKMNTMHKQDAMMMNNYKGMQENMNKEMMRNKMPKRRPQQQQMQMIKK